MARAIGKYSVAIEGHRTSVSLEPEFWHALKVIAAARGVTLGALVTEVDRIRAGNLSSALRVFVLKEIVKQPGTVKYPFPEDRGLGRGVIKPRSERSAHPSHPGPTVRHGWS